MVPDQPNAHLHTTSWADELPIAELSSARLDGEIYTLGDSWCAIDEIDGPANRARATALLVPWPAVVERASAAWIYGLAPEPTCHELRLDSRARKYVATSVHLQVREVRAPYADTVEFAGVSVTTPLHTAVDLALCRRHPLGDTEEPRLVALLAALLLYSEHRDAHEALDACGRAHSPARQRAQVRFSAVQALFDLTTVERAAVDRAG